MNIKIYKTPEFEDNDCLFEIDGFQLNVFKLINLLKCDYFKTKMNKFGSKDISKFGFEPFTDRSSLRNFDEIADLRGSIYTYACEERNNMDYETILESIKSELENNPSNRRLIVRILNPLSEYLSSGLDVSCLAYIHYLSNNVKLNFRAWDLQNEALIDLITIYWFFIEPIYDENPIISIYSSTCQNVKEFDTLIKNIKHLE